MGSDMKKYNPARQLSGVKEIARRANVSIATVDRVIHNRKGVSEATREKINAIIEEIGFQPNILASRLASKKTNRFAVIIPSSKETDYWESPRKGIERAGEEIKQYGVFIEKYFYDLNERTSFSDIAKEVLSLGFDGVVMAPLFIEESIAFVKTCRQKNIPCVFINSDIPEQDSLSYFGPHLFQSGYQAGQLISYGLREGKILIVNISKETDSYYYLLRKEEGFRAYFNEQGKTMKKLIKVDIHDTDRKSIASEMKKTFIAHPDVKAVFVTNSRVLSVAYWFEKSKIQDTILVGYDYLPENIAYLKRGVIDFLICQKPEEQGYLGMMSLFQHVVSGTALKKENFMPIDIITKENYMFYKN